MTTTGKTRKLHCQMRDASDLLTQVISWEGCAGHPSRSAVTKKQQVTNVGIG